MMMWNGEWMVRIKFNDQKNDGRTNELTNGQFIVVVIVRTKQTKKHCRKSIEFYTKKKNHCFEFFVNKSFFVRLFSHDNKTKQKCCCLIMRVGGWFFFSDNKNSIDFPLLNPKEKKIEKMDVLVNSKMLSTYQIYTHTMYFNDRFLGRMFVHYPYFDYFSFQQIKQITK